MAGPETVVREHGEDVELEAVVDYETDANGQVVDESEETVSIVIPAVVSQPSEQDEQRVEGRLGTGSLRLTVPSSFDGFGEDYGDTYGGVGSSGHRPGRRDRIFRPPREGYGRSYGENYGGNPSSRVYQVVEVRDDRHPMTGTRKTTVLVDRLGGR